MKQALSRALQTLEEQMHPIPAGSIRLNDDRIQRQWTEQILPFQLSAFTLTQAHFEAFMGYNPSAFPAPDQPVETVSWWEAVQCCNARSQAAGLTACYKLNQASHEVYVDPDADGYRLPTEAEWQYACQAGDLAVRYGDLDDIAWYKANSAGHPHSVGQKLPNAWGLYDMLGNVWEWCTDLYDETVYGSYRILRGGGWYDEARGVLATNRRRSHPVSFRIDDVGFRVARRIR
ncbi:MAG: SUMF1/EgtB/PvdO family nonheme iron enzyme [Bacteroidota bacterium]